MQVEMSDEMHVTKTEPVLRWQTKEEFQRWERRVHEAKQRFKDGVGDEKEGRKRGRGGAMCERGALFQIQQDSKKRRGRKRNRPNEANISLEERENEAGGSRRKN